MECNMYDRTCGNKEVAEQRVSELKKVYQDAKYFESGMPKDYIWFY